jgi:hypothetical protein
MHLGHGRPIALKLGGRGDPDMKGRFVTVMYMHTFQPFVSPAFNQRVVLRHLLNSSPLEGEMSSAHSSVSDHALASGGRLTGTVNRITSRWLRGHVNEGHDETDSWLGVLIASLLLANRKPLGVRSKNGHHSPGGASWAMASARAPRGHNLSWGPVPRVRGGQDRN